MAAAAKRAPTSVRAESLLRGLCAAMAAAAALLLGLSAQTKTVLFVRKKAVPKDVEALWVLIVAAAAAAGYHVVQLLKCYYFRRLAADNAGGGRCCCSVALAWISFLLDKVHTHAYFCSSLILTQFRQNTSTHALGKINQ